MASREYVNITGVHRNRRHYMAGADAGTRYVIQRSKTPLAALVSLADLKRLHVMQPAATAPIKFNLTTARAELTRLAEEASFGRQYVITAEYPDRTYSAALIGLNDLKLLESGTLAAKKMDKTAERDEKFRRALEDAGIEVSWPTGEPVPDSERVLIQLRPGERLLSEQIIAERR